VNGCADCASRVREVVDRPSACRRAEALLSSMHKVNGINTTHSLAHTHSTYHSLRHILSLAAALAARARACRLYFIVLSNSFKFPTSMGTRRLIRTPMRDSKKGRRRPEECENCHKKRLTHTPLAFQSRNKCSLCIGAPGDMYLFTRCLNATIYK
jgi:hypothetical protein